jgi:hypothetical protein
MNPSYLAPKHVFCVGSQTHASGLHLSFVIPLHDFAVFDVVIVVAADFAGIPPKKYHPLKRMIAAGINILKTTLFTILYWKLLTDDIFAILLYIIQNILFSWNASIQPTKYFLSMAVLSAMRRNIFPKSLFTSASSTGPIASILIFKYCAFFLLLYSVQP